MGATLRIGNRNRNRLGSLLMHWLARRRSFDSSRNGASYAWPHLSWPGLLRTCSSCAWWRVYRDWFLLHGLLPGLHSLIGQSKIDGNFLDHREVHDMLGRGIGQRKGVKAQAIDFARNAAAHPNNLAYGFGCKERLALVAG